MDATTAFLLNEKSDVAWACLGSPSTFDHMLVLLGCGGDSVVSEGENLRARLGNFQFAGVFGFRSADNYANAISEPGQELVMVAAFRTFAQRLTEHLEIARKGEAVSWLKQLHDLTDPRTEEN